MSASPKQDPTPPFPERIGRYELLLPLGTGGMATVFLARTRGVGGFEREVALKLLHAHLREDEESKLQLLEEAKLAARIRNPNVVPVLEVDEDPFGLYLVMDYVEGETLAGLIAAAHKNKERLPLRLAARILSDALSGLHAAHELCDEQGKRSVWVHRDFSPQNIVVGVDGIARLTDFGVAKAAGRAVKTKTGLVKGKVAYMSARAGARLRVDRRCDVWAGGIVAWELIAGKKLHGKKDDVSTLLSVVTEEPPPLSGVVGGVSDELEEAVASALTGDLGERCPTAAELRRRLEAAWSSSTGIADAEEVGKYVAAVAGPKLARRRERIAEVRTLRARMGEIVRPEEAPESTPSTPSEPPRHEPATVRAVPMMGRPLAFEPSPSRTPGPIDHSAVLPAPEPRSSARRLLVASGAAALIAAAIAAVAAFRTSSTSSGEPASTERPRAAQPITARPVAAQPTRLEDLEQVEASEPAPTASTDETQRAAPTTGETVAPTRRGSRGSAKRTAPKRTAGPQAQVPSKLADDPYGGGQ